MILNVKDSDEDFSTKSSSDEQDEQDEQASENEQENDDQEKEESVPEPKDQPNSVWKSTNKKLKILDYIDFYTDKNPNLETIENFQFDLEGKGWTSRSKKILVKNVENEIERRFSGSRTKAPWAKTSAPKTEDEIWDWEGEEKLGWKPPGIAQSPLVVDTQRSKLEGYLPGFKDWLLQSLNNFGKSRETESKFLQYKTGMSPYKTGQNHVKDFETVVRLFMDYVEKTFGEIHCDWSAFLSFRMTNGFIQCYKASSGRQTWHNTLKILRQTIQFFGSTNNCALEYWSNTLWVTHMKLSLQSEGRTSKIARKSLNRRVHSEEMEKQKSYDFEGRDEIFKKGTEWLQKQLPDLLNKMTKPNRKLIPKLIQFKCVLKLFCQMLTGGIFVAVRRQVVSGMDINNFKFNRDVYQLRPDFSG